MKNIISTKGLTADLVNKYISIVFLMKQYIFL